MPQNRRRDPQLEQFWRKQLAAWKRSGRSARDFCASHRLQESSFYGWRRTLRQRDRQPPVAQRLPRLVPLRVLSGVGLEVVLPTGLVVRVPAGAEAAAVATLVAALRAATC